MNTDIIDSLDRAYQERDKWRLEAELLRAEVEIMEEALCRMTAPMRPDGTWNLDREACRQIAFNALLRLPE